MAKGRGMSAARVVSLLSEVYAPLGSALDYKTPWELLVAVQLSAQCTDARVNLITPRFFKELPTMDAVARAARRTIERLIFSAGYYHSKARNIQQAARFLRDECAGVLPGSMDALLRVPGVGRKSANVLLHLIYGKVEGIVVDTHIFRVSRRTGVSAASTPEAVERDLMRALPKEDWILYGDLAIQHGRRVCHARRPACDGCPLVKHCPCAFGL